MILPARAAPGKKRPADANAPAASIVEDATADERSLVESASVAASLQAVVTADLDASEVE